MIKDGEKVFTPSHPIVYNIHNDEQQVLVAASSILLILGQAVAQDRRINLMSGQQTIAATTKMLICETDEQGNGLSISEIVDRIHDLHPGCKTTKACVSWYLSKTRKGEFDDVAPEDLPRVRNRSNSTLPPTPVVVSPYESFTALVTQLSEHELATPKLTKYLEKTQTEADETELARLQAVADAEAEAATDQHGDEAEGTAETEDISETEEPSNEELEDIEAEIADIV